MRHRTCARDNRIETESFEHRVHARRKRVPAFTLEPLEIAVVLREHLRCRRISRVSQSSRLLLERFLQREKLGEFARTGFPYSLRSAEIAMLLENCGSQSRLSAHHSLTRFHLSKNDFEEGSLSRSVAAEYPPPVALSDGECDAAEDPVCAEFDADVRESDLSQLLCAECEAGDKVKRFSLWESSVSPLAEGVKNRETLREKRVTREWAAS